MDKTDWQASLAALKTFLKQKEDELAKPDRVRNEIEELKLTIAAYEEKVKSFG